MKQSKLDTPKMYMEAAVEVVLALPPRIRLLEFCTDAW